MGKTTTFLFLIILVAALVAGLQGAFPRGETVTEISFLPPESIADVVEQVEPAVVYVSAAYEGNTKTGSGVILSSDGYILTNNHVVEGASHIEVTLTDKQTYSASLKGTDSLTDLAVIKIEGSNLPTAQFGDATQLREGDWVVAIGNALGLAGGPTVTAGIVSNLERSFIFGGSTYYDIIQTDAAINPGNSGGPLVNLEGKVIGINTFIITDVENMGFAISQATAQSVYEALRDYGTVARPYLGVTLQNLTPDLATMYSLTKNKGVLITYVEPDTPAYDEGLHQYDVITSFEGEEVDEASQLIKLLWQKNPGDTVTITYWRDDQEYEVTLTLAQRPDSL